MRKKNILVPTDFTSVAETGLLTAIDLANQIGANIDLLHIIKDYGSTGFEASGDVEASTREHNERDHFMMELIKKRKTQMNSLIDIHSAKGIQFKAFVEFGSFEEQLENHMKANAADLVVMGTTGETSVSEYLSGNHAAKAIRAVDVPVLAVKKHYPLFMNDKLLILVELKEYDLNKVKLIKKFADLLQLQILIGHVKQLKDVVKGDIYEELQKFALENNFLDSKIHIIGRGEKTKAVKDFVRAYKVNIIASISDSESGLIRFLFGSDTDDFINDIDRPLIAVGQ